MRKLAVLGNAGGGKSTLSRRLARELQIPYFSVDAIIWNSATEKAPGEEVCRIHSFWLTKDSWIIDGWGDFSLIEQRLAAADRIILIEHPLWRHCWWATKREGHNLLARAIQRKPPAEILGQTWQIVKAIRWIHRIGLPWLKEHLDERKAENKLITVRTLKELDSLEWIAPSS